MPCLVKGILLLVEHAGEIKKKYSPRDFDFALCELTYCAFDALWNYLRSSDLLCIRSAFPLQGKCHSPRPLSLQCCWSSTRAKRYKLCMLMKNELALEYTSKVLRFQCNMCCSEWSLRQHYTNIQTFLTLSMKMLIKTFVVVGIVSFHRALSSVVRNLSSWHDVCASFPGKNDSEMSFCQASEFPFGRCKSSTVDEFHSCCNNNKYCGRSWEECSVESLWGVIRHWWCSAERERSPDQRLHVSFLFCLPLPRSTLQLTTASGIVLFIQRCIYSGLRTVNVHRFTTTQDSANQRWKVSRYFSLDFFESA